MPIWQEFLLALAIVVGAGVLGSKLLPDTPTGRYVTGLVMLVGTATAAVVEIIVGAPTWLVIMLIVLAAIFSLGSGGEDVPEGWRWISRIAMAPGVLATVALVGVLAWLALGKALQWEAVQSGFGLLKNTPNISSQEYDEIGSASLDTRPKVEDRFGEGEKDLRERDPKCRYYWEDAFFSTKAYEVCFNRTGRFYGKREVDTESFP